MAWTVPATYSNGQIVTNTNLNTDHRDNLRELWHEVAYVEFTSTVSSGAGTEAAPTDVVSSGALTYTAVPIVVEFYCGYVGAGNGTFQGISLWDGTTDLGRLLYAAGGAIQSANTTLLRRLTPTAASHTYKIRTYGNGPVSLIAGAGGVATQLPGYIRVWQKGA